MGKPPKRKPAPEPVPPPYHPLVEPRIVAAVGIVALGGGLGVGLMLAKTLTLVGLALSLSAALGVFWIYAQPFGAAYSALATKTVYKGPSVKELAIALFIIATVIPVSIVLYFDAAKKEEWRNRAVMQYAGIVPVIDITDPTKTYFNVTIKNDGDQEAKNLVWQVKGKFVVGGELPTKPEQDSTMNDLFKQTGKAYKIGQKGVVLPTKGQIGTVFGVRITAGEFEKLEKAEAYVFLYAVAFYQDELTENTNMWWVTEVCGYTTGDQELLHICAGTHNRVYQVSGLPAF